jgi:hypothetical protein
MKRFTWNHYLLLSLIITALIVPSCAIGQKPRQGLQAFLRAVKAKDWNRAWDSVSSSTQKGFEQMEYKPMQEKIKSMPPDAQKNFKIPRLGITPDKILAMSVKEYFGFVMDKSGMAEQILKRTNPDSLDIEQETIKGDKATIKLKGQPGEIPLIKEKGAWKVDFMPAK